jgi:hypothetical protein
MRGFSEISGFKLRSRVDEGEQARHFLFSALIKL